MRQRFARFRGRSMARRPGETRRITLSPTQRRVAGWVAAIAIVAAVAIALRMLGGNADGEPVDPAAGSSPSAPAAVPIEFGTAIDPATGVVAATSRASTFQPDDTFAYSARTSGVLPETIYVEVARIGGDAEEVVQAIPEDGDQALPADAEVIAFSVPASALFDAWGPGSYEMRIYTDPVGEPVAAGRFDLADPAAAPGTGLPSASP